MSDDHPHDLRLVEAVRAGSREAAGELVDRHWHACWRIARGVLGDPVAAEDVVQESLVAALDKIATFDHRRGHFAAWLHRITVNRAINELRRRGRGAVSLEEIAAYGGEDAPGDGAFLAAVAGLKPVHRVVVVLRYGLDYSPSEIGAVLELPVGTVNSRLSRALDSLRLTMEPPHVH